MMPRAMIHPGFWMYPGGAAAAQWGMAYPQHWAPYAYGYYPAFQVCLLFCRVYAVCTLEGLARVSRQPSRSVSLRAAAAVHKPEAVGETTHLEC